MSTGYSKSGPVRGRILLSVAGDYSFPLQKLLSTERDVVIDPDGPVDPSIDYAVVWKHQHGLLSRLPNLRAIFSIGAGVDHIFADPGLPDKPVVRVIAEDLTRHMTEYVVWRVLDHHRLGLSYRSQQAGRIWRELPQPTASDITVGIMGLGHLGRAAASTLLKLDYKVNGWTRTPRQVEGVTCSHGVEGLNSFLAASDILVVLLPHTPETVGLIGYNLLRGLRRDNALGGAVLVNAGRGRLQKEDEILRALEDGTLKEASLDVFEREPLAETSPLWTHPRVCVTPHAAATSDPARIASLILRQMESLERGEALQHVVDRQAGY